ncbi:MAG: prepilin peptidase [bacterium]
MTPFFYLVMMFLFGTAIGSFSNVLIFRYNPDLNVFSPPHISGRSHCPKCGHNLSWYELIPIISFLIQGGRCRSCNAKISWQYIIVELIGGSIFAGIPLFLNSFYGIAGKAFFAFSLPYWYYCLIASWILVFWVLLLITVIDLRLFIIPDELTIFLIVLGAGITFFLSQNIHGLLTPFRTSFLQQYELLLAPISSIWLSHIAGAIGGFLFFLALSILTRGRGIGFGDVKLSFALGIIFGWPDMAILSILAFIVGGLWSVGLVILGAKKMKDKVPFAPFFVVGTLLTFFFGMAIVKGYLGAFGL